MKTQLSNFVLGLALLSPAIGFSQAGGIQPCNTYAAMEQRFAADAQARASYEATQQTIQANYEAYSTHNINSRTAALSQYTIPVVFHILHMGGGENITDQDCQDALAQINRDYAKANADTTQIFAPFQSLYINSGIKFMLAHKDPNGVCTNGIIHTYDTRTNWNQALTSNFTGITWDPTRYLNVIVVKQIIDPGSTSSGIIVGYTYVPGTWPAGSAKDAVVYNSSYVNGLQARSMSHEFGHWLGLKHTFGNTNNPGVVCGSSSGGDGISDTPDTKGNFSNCPNSNTNPAKTCLSPASDGTYYQNVQNFMDYSSCPLNFTTGQTNMMRSILASNTSSRSVVVSQTNLTSTDVNGVIPCAPVAEYLSSNGSYTVCAGGSLTMKDFSYNGVITTYQWAGDNGVSISAAGASITPMVFPVIGVSNVTLTVSNAQGSSTRIRQVTVIDGNPPGGLPAVESFENPNTPIPPHWVVTNTGNGGWERTEDAAYDGIASYYIKGANVAASEQNYLQMPVMNLAASSDKTLTFSYAYAKSTNTQNDQLKVQGSKDCGGTWTDIISLNASNMALNSGGVTAAEYIPALEEWKTFTISTLYAPWAQFINATSVLLRFDFVEGSTGGGNNIYIDAAKMISSPVGINELAKSMEMTVYPNPSNGEVSMAFKLDNAADVKINVVDIYGKVVLPVVDSRLTPGQQIISINKENKLATGIYIIDMNYNGTRISNKLIIQ